MILFRCSADATIGFGHLARCRALAAALVEQGVAVAMAGPGETVRQPEDEMLFAHWFEMPADRGSEQDARILADIARKIGARLLALDDYRVDETYQLVLCDEGLRWLQFQSPDGRPVWADLVLHANPTVMARDYQAMLRNPATRLLLGPHYALLRPEFGHAALRTRTIPRQVMLAFGAGDDRGAIRRIVPLLLAAAPADMRVVVVSGARNPNNTALAEWLPTVDDGRVILTIDPPDLAAIMRDSDIAVTSGGTLTYELAACGVAMLIVAISNNQLESAAWERRGAAIFLGSLAAMPDERLIGRFAELCRDTIEREAMRGRAAPLVDGQGASRVARILRESI